MILESSQGALVWLGFRWHYQQPCAQVPLTNSAFLANSPTLNNPTKDPIITQTMRWLDVYFSGEIPRFSPPIAFKGSAFQQCVWEIVRGIGYGEVRSYGELAAQVASHMGMNACAQAVGGALKRNPIVLIIPCHRIICANGALGGYVAGESIKHALLQLENESRL